MSDLIQKFALILIGFTLSFSMAFATEINPTEIDQMGLIEPASFSDIKEENMNYLPILELAKFGYIKGYDDGTFKSGNSISRAEALKIVMEFLEIFDQEENPPEENPFKDVETTSWYAPYIAQAKEKGIAAGYSDETFKPNAQVSLAEALKLIVASIPNYQERTPTEAPFEDVPVSEWFTQYVVYAKEREMLNITSENKINPNDLLTRGQFSTLIYKLRMFSEGYNFGKATFYGLAVQGSGTASGEQFDMNQHTAAHKTLPFGTLVDVTNLANGKTTQVRITDRGPYGPGRVLDLSSAAFKDISTLSRGIINIQFKVVSTP